MLIYRILFYALSIAPADPCETKLRAAIDVGSGSVKLTMSEVDYCNGKLRPPVRLISDDVSVRVRLEETRDVRGNLHRDEINKTVGVIKELRLRALEKAAAMKPKPAAVEFSAVGTHAVREAANREELISKIQALGIPMREISQQTEGRYGFEGVDLIRPRPCPRTEDMVVWDIGGGSLQITSLKKGARPPYSEKDYQVKKGKFGSGAYKSRLISILSPQKKLTDCSISEPTPNPIGGENFKAAESLAVAMATEALGDKISRHLKDKCVVGIGGLHTAAIEGQIKKFWGPKMESCICFDSVDPSTCARTLTREDGGYSLKEVRCLAEILAEKTDCDESFRSEFSTTNVSNVFLILGMLKHFKLDRIKTAKVNMGNRVVSDSSKIEFASVAVPNTTQAELSPVTPSAAGK